MAQEAQDSEEDEWWSEDTFTSLSDDPSCSLLARVRTRR